MAVTEFRVRPRGRRPAAGARLRAHAAALGAVRAFPRRAQELAAGNGASRAAERRERRLRRVSSDLAGNNAVSAAAFAGG